VARSPDHPRLGRPQKRDEDGTPTRERLLAAAVAACVERGFEGTTIADIAHRAGVTTPAAYTHFDGKVELLVEAGRWALDRMRPDVGAQMSGADVARAFLADSFADSRRMLTELHAAGQRHPEVADLLAKWHGDHAAGWAARMRGPDRSIDVKLFFALLLGLAQVDAMASLPRTGPDLAARVDDLVRVLIPEEHATA
jgi:AcrR family transcriptional regulator